MRNKMEVKFIYHAYAIVLVFLGALSLELSPVQGVILMNSLNTPFLDQFFSATTNLGNGLILVPFLIILSWTRIYLSIGLFANGMIQGIIVSIFKQVIFPSAKRPIQFLDLAEVHTIPGITIHSMKSFPSGHTVTIFGLCIFLSLCYRNRLLTIILLAVASLVAISRVYLLQHFFIDVTAGAAIGITVGIIVYHFFEDMNKPTWMTKRINPKWKINRPQPKFS